MLKYLDFKYMEALDVLIVVIKMNIVQRYIEDINIKKKRYLILKKITTRFNSEILSNLEISY